ncbi:phage tail assembly chaperone [Novosphingobium sp. KCTC 2891]|uniref:phage tail assembly chaperone n=1 Tax=Novosphingobium sp. KCTC 2891 TaxID=2989730 RepID=UPI002223E002|nr:phage tail assembly chaperone [Novosphingobium sp. KCTC 2891]MCW1383215.1 phage tail assembly chaperone [Novosphingobium sp. KCTC 2891]
MTEQFGAGAARLSGQIGLWLGWSPERFWQATPEELASVLTAAAPAAGDGIDRRTLNALMEHEQHG